MLSIDWKMVVVAAMGALTICYCTSRMSGCSEVVYTHDRKEPREKVVYVPEPVGTAASFPTAISTSVATGQ